MVMCCKGFGFTDFLASPVFLPGLYAFMIDVKKCVYFVPIVFI